MIDAPFWLGIRKQEAWKYKLTKQSVKSDRVLEATIE